MAVVLLSGFGTFERRSSGARHALKSWGYRLLKARGGNSIDVARFAIIDGKSGEIVAGESSQTPRLTLPEVEDWFNQQGFGGKLAADGTRLRDVGLETMTPAQREIVERMQALPRSDRLLLARYFSTALLREKLD